MIADGPPTGLLAAVERRRLGAIDVVRVTPAGCASRREALFDKETLSRWWSAGVAPATVVTRSRRLVLHALQWGRRAS